MEPRAEPRQIPALPTRNRHARAVEPSGTKWNQVEPRAEPRQMSALLKRNHHCGEPHRLLFILLNKRRCGHTGDGSGFSFSIIIGRSGTSNRTTHRHPAHRRAASWAAGLRIWIRAPVRQLSFPYCQMSHLEAFSVPGTSPLMQSPWRLDFLHFGDAGPAPGLMWGVRNE